MRRRAWAIPLFLLVVFPAVHTVGAAPELDPSFDETSVQSYPLQPGGAFTLTNINGAVRIEGWEKSEVEVHAVKRAVKARADLARVRIEVESLPAAVHVRTRYPEDDPAGVNVEYRIRVPYRTLLGRVETINGNLAVSGVEGSGELRTVNGNVDVFDSAGKFSARTTNGEVHAEFRQLAAAGQMTLEAVNGGVLLALPSEASATLDVASMNGEFYSELPIARPGSWGREFRGNLGRGGMTVRLRTVNGGIAIVTLRPSI
jgi:DUF4097 and DUF4098 domain-containing protein YvlB